MWLRMMRRNVKYPMTYSVAAISAHVPEFYYDILHGQISKSQWERLVIRRLRNTNFVFNYFHPSKAVS